MDTKNLVFLVGRLAADPELRYLNNGTPVSNFSVAVNRTTRKSGGGLEDSLDGFFDCELFGAQALALAESCKKGAEVQLSGSLRQKKFETKGEQPRKVSRIEVRVDSIAPVLVVPKASGSQAAPQEAPEPQPA